MGLTNKRKAFVAEYLKEFNATRAAKAAGYSDKTAYSQGQRLLKNVEVSKAIKDSIEMSANEVKSRLADIARGDIADLMEITPTGFTLELMTRDASGNLITNPKTKLIKKIKQKVTTYLAKKEDDEDREIIETEIELYSAHDALRDIGRIHALFMDKSEVTNDGEIILRVIYDNRPGNTLADASPETEGVHQQSSQAQDNTGG